MALRTFVKVGSITNLSDARYCAGMGVDMLGFRAVEGDPAYIEAKRFQEIRGWVTGPSVVAEIYGLAKKEDIAAVLENYRPDYLELGTRELALLASEPPLPYLLYLKQGEAAPDVPQPPAYLILSGAPAATTSAPALVAIKDQAELGTLLDNNAVSGIVLEGTPEVRPGLKAYDELSAILELLEED